MRELLKLDQQLKKLPAFLANIPEVLTAFLFGSYGTSNQTALSDIDFAVLFNKKLDLNDEAEFLACLSQFLGTDRVDLVNLNKAPLTLQFRAITQGKIVYERDYITTCDFLEKIADLYQDYAIDLNYYNEEYDEALKEAYGNGRQGENPE